MTLWPSFHLSTLLSLFLACLAVTVLAQAQTQEQDVVVSYVLESFEESTAVNDLVLLWKDDSSDESQISSTTNDSFLGQKALKVDYYYYDTTTSTTSIPFSLTVESILQEEYRVHNVYGATFLSFWYKLATENGPSPPLIVSLIDSDAVCEEQEEDCQQSETWQYYTEIPLLNGTDWRQVWIPTAASEWERVQGYNNGKLDLDRIRGWRMELSSNDDSVSSKGVFWMDHLSFEGGQDLLGAFLHTKSYSEAARDVTIKRIIHDSERSENNTEEHLEDGAMIIDYWVEQRESWGGYLSYQMIPPGRAYFNLSKADAVSLNYTINQPLSEPGRGHFRLVLFDGSDCVGDCSYDAENLENFYSFHYILEDDQGTIVVELEGDDDSLSPFWNPGWSGIGGNQRLDKDNIRGVKFEIVIDYQGKQGSSMEGGIVLSNLQALEQYNSTEKDVSQCIVEPELRLVTPEQYFRRIEFLNFDRCCETCQANPTCNFALTDGRDCFIGEHVERKHVRLVNSDYEKNSFTVFWKDTLESRGEVCDVCTCDTKGRSIDCRGSDLILPPIATGTQLWGPTVLDLRENPRLLILGRNSFEGFDSLEELLLPSNLFYLSPDTTDYLHNLKKVVYEEEDQPTMIANVISSKQESFGDVCCSIGASGQEWSFCNMQIEQPGANAVYENFTHYLSTETLRTIVPSSPLFSEATDSEHKCAEYCSILESCRYFSYDARLPNAFPICYHFNYVTQVEEVCCHEEHYRDENMTIPGWVSGRVHRTRCESDDARVYVTHNDTLTLSEDNGFETEYSVHLGAQPIRGAVWVEPNVLSNEDNAGIYTIPTRVVLYDNETVATIKVCVSDGSKLRDSFTITITNEVTACDSAFATSNSCVSPDDLAVYVEVVPSNKTFMIVFSATVAAVVTIVLVLVAVYVYSDHKRRQADLLWQINPEEIVYKDPPQVLGQGTFGKVLLAEYRGTHVAVKRVIPPQNNFELSERRYGSSSRNDGDVEHGTGNDLPNWKSSSSEMHSQIGFRTLGSQIGFRTLGRRNWNGTFKFPRDEFSMLKAQFIDEMRHLSKLRHPCITTVMGAVINRVDDPCLVLEWMEHGSLWDLLHNETVPIEGEQILPILRDMTSGLRFLHSSTPIVVHGDLKARNVLVDSHFRAKVSDFGLTQKRRLGAAGTPYWTAPEVLLGRSDNTAEADVYSFGIILYEIYSRENPYDGEPFEKVLKDICDPAIKKRPPVPDSCPVEIQSIMVDCLEAAPGDRPTFEHLDLRLKQFDVDSVQPGQTPRKHFAREDDSLLFEVFPHHIAKALREGRRVEPEFKDMVTILFCDIVGFTSISESLEPMKVANVLDRLYLKFDALSRVHNVLKIETVGDCWMGATNLISDQSKDHVKRVAEFALDAVAAANSTLIDSEDPKRGFVSIRVGFHSGPVVADVVGSRNPRWCLFGDTVNVSSRMESHSMPDSIQCSAVSARLLQQQDPAACLVARGRIDIKGKDPMHTFWVKKKKIDTLPRQPARQASRRHSTGMSTTFRGVGATFGDEY